MFEDLLAADQEWFKLKLFEEKDYVDLGIFHQAISSQESYRKSSSHPDSLAYRFDPTDRDHTLSYLHPLLKEGKMKAAVQTWEKAEGKDWELLRKYYPKSEIFTLTREWKEYTSKNADEFTETVRQRWNACPKDDLSPFETGVIFRLPDTLWGGDDFRSYTHEEAMQMFIDADKHQPER